MPVVDVRTGEISDGPAEQVVRRLYDELWSQRRLEVAAEILSPAIASGDPAARNRPAGSHSGLMSEPPLPPFWHNQIEKLLVAGDRVVARMTWSGTHTGPFEGIEPTGARVECVGAGFFSVSGGLIEEAWIVGDSKAFWDALKPS